MVESTSVRAEVAGTVIAVLVERGDTLSEGVPVVLLESMKMELPVLTESAGRVVQLLVTPGDTVQRDAAVAVLTPFS